MAVGAEKPSAFQLINDHIKKLDQDVNKIDDLQKHLDKLKESAQDDIYWKYDSLVNAIKESHAGTGKQLDELYQQQKRKLDEARQKLIDRKTKAETELIVDHKLAEMPEVSLNCTINIVNASQAIGLLKLSAESGIGLHTFFTLPKQEPKAESSAAVGGFSFSFPSTSSDSGATPVFASLSIPSIVPPQSKEATRKRKMKEAAAKTESLLHPSPPTPKMNKHSLRDFVRCINCRRPRCVYSSKKLTRDNQECWNGVKGILPYHCGANLFPTQLLAVEMTDCSKEVSLQYFSHERKFPVVCYNCGFDISSSSSSSKQMHEDKESDMIIHDVCQSCKDRGIKPRTRKKKPASKKANIDSQLVDLT